MKYELHATVHRRRPLPIAALLQLLVDQVRAAQEPETARDQQGDARGGTQ